MLEMNIILRIAKKLIFILILFIQSVNAQIKRPLPVIDMHFHANILSNEGSPPTGIKAPFIDFGYFDPKEVYRKFFYNSMLQNAKTPDAIKSPLTNSELMKLNLAALDKHNVYAVTSGDLKDVREYKKASPRRIINAILWDFSEIKRQGLSVDSLERLFKSGEFKIFGEVAIQYEGYSPSDSIFEPFLAMAERLDIPIGIHIGPGPRGVAYMQYPHYRARLHSAFVLEEALIKHPKLRLYAMHAGWPLIDDMIATMYAHPQLYVDLGLISYVTPRKEFYFYLERLVNAGFGKRIMFGSDNLVYPDAVSKAINSIQNAPFLTSIQKRDILFNNASRFLRLSPNQIEAMK